MTYSLMMQMLLEGPSAIPERFLDFGRIFDIGVARIRAEESVRKLVYSHLQPVLQLESSHKDVECSEDVQRSRQLDVSWFCHFDNAGEVRSLGKGGPEHR